MYGLPASRGLESARTSVQAVASDVEQEILEALFVSDPQKDLLKARNRARKGRAEGSCQWILDRPEYATWRDHATPQLLMVVGEAGIGKTAMATFLVERLAAEAATEKLTFAYFFCSHAEPQRSTATAVLKGLLHQVMTRRPQLVEHAQRVFEVHGLHGFEDFEVLWFLFVRAVQDPRAGQLTLLIDSLDNCHATLRKRLVGRLEELLRSTAETKQRHWRLLILTRPHAWDLGTCRRLVSGWTELEWMVVITMSPVVVDSDLRRHIAEEVDDMAAIRHWTDDTWKAVKMQLEANNGGTFLWISLALRCVADTKEDFILRKLKRYSGSLRDLYIRILRKIDPEDIDIAECTLHYVLGASRPLTLTELAIALYYRDSMNRTGQLLPSDAQIDDLKSAMRCCEILLRINGKGQHATVEFVHQSVADFLLEHSMPFMLRRYKTTLQKAADRLSIACAAYLCTSELKSFALDIKRLVRQGKARTFCKLSPRSRDSMLDREVSHADSSAFSRHSSEIWSTVSYLPMSTKQMALLQYATSTWAAVGSWRQLRTLPIHALELIKLHGRRQDLIFETAKIAISEGHDLIFRHLIKILLRRLSLDDGLHLLQSTIQYDESGTEPALGSRERVYWTEELPDAEAIYYELKQRWNNLVHAAASLGLVDVVKFCVQHDDDVVLKDVNSLTPLHMAARAGHLEVVKVLARADKSKSTLSEQDRHGQLPLHVAVTAAKQDDIGIIKALLKADHRKSSLHIRDQKGETPLHGAVKLGRLPLISVLLGADINKLAVYIPETTFGRLPLHSSVFTGCVEIVRLLAQADNSSRTLIARDKDGKTALDLATEIGWGEEKEKDWEYGYVDGRTLIADFLHRESMMLLFGEVMGKMEKVDVNDTAMLKGVGVEGKRARPRTVTVRGRSSSM